MHRGPPASSRLTLLLVTSVKEIRRFPLLLSAEKGDDYFVGRFTLTLSQELTRLNIAGEEKKSYSNFILNIIPVSSGCILRGVCHSRGRLEIDSSFSNSACDDQKLIFSNLLVCIPNPGAVLRLGLMRTRKKHRQVMKPACQGCDSIINSQSLNCVVGPGCW